MIESLVQFGVAGLMGTLWVWERMYSRKRETQLSESHDRLMEQNHELSELIQLVRQNTEAVVGFEQAQKRMCDLLEGMANEMRKANRAA
ncbi:MAG: hypothetical protein GC162_16885 [Planctomycetes bacterium]|nr:hypothetical protein [Planctomycetota bacterium]